MKKVSCYNLRVSVLWRWRLALVAGFKVRRLTAPTGRRQYDRDLSYGAHRVGTGGKRVGNNTQTFRQARAVAYPAQADSDRMGR